MDSMLTRDNDLQKNQKKKLKDQEKNMKSASTQI